MPSSYHDRFSSNLSSSSSIIHRIPVEILTIIFFYVGSPSAENSYYVYFILSWVCRHWRSIILRNPNFWTVIRPNAWDKDSDFIEEILRRSQSRPLDIFTYTNYIWHPGDKCSAEHYVISESSRIRSLGVQNPSLFLGPSKLHCPTLFPQLENLIFHGIMMAQDMVHPVLLASRPRYIQFSGGAFLRKHVQMSQNLAHVEWLKFHCFIDQGTSLILQALFQALQHLPSLRILNLILQDKGFYYCQRLRSILSTSLPVVTLPNLRMLSLDLWNDIFHSRICTPPTLDYVGLSRHSRDNVTHDWVFLDHIDLSMTKGFLVTLYDGESHLRYNIAQSLIARITMGDYDENNNNNYQIFETFHREISPVTSSSVDSYLVVPPKNTFYIELHRFGDIGAALSNHLKRAVNLVQLTLDYQSFKSDSDNIVVASQLLSTLDTVTHLKVLRCRNFSAICEILMEKGNVPGLERLTYHSSRKSRIGPALVLRRLKMMQDERPNFIANR